MNIFFKILSFLTDAGVNTLLTLLQKKTDSLPLGTEVLITISITFAGAFLKYLLKLLSNKLINNKNPKSTEYKSFDSSYNFENVLPKGTYFLQETVLLTK